MEEPDYHEEMGVERKQPKGIISVLAVKQEVKEKRLKTRITTQVPVLRLKRPLQSYKTKKQLSLRREKGGRTYYSALLSAPTILMTSFWRATTRSLSFSKSSSAHQAGKAPAKARAESSPSSN